MSQKQAHVRRGEIIVHDYDSQIENIEKMIDEELSENNRKLVHEYHKEMVRTSLGKATRTKHLATVLSLSRMLGKDWQAVTKADIDELVYLIMSQYSPKGQETHSTRDHKKILKIFFRWIRRGSRQSRRVGDPDETKHIGLNPIRSKIVREQLITEDDLARLLKACIGNPRDKAMIYVHYEAGTRIGELLSLRIKHVKFDEFGAVIHVDGKTGARPIRIVKSVPTLSHWLNEHPNNQEPESPLWVLFDNAKIGQPVTYYAAKKILDRILQRTNLNKKFNWKLFRHSEATNSARFLNESQMRMRHGWTPSSKMPENYVHLVNADVDNAYLQHYGIKKSDNTQEKLPKICHICKTPNSHQDEICNSCGKPLDLKKAIQIEEKASQEGLETKKALAIIVKTMLSQPQNLLNISQNDIESLQKQLNL